MFVIIIICALLAVVVIDLFHPPACAYTMKTYCIQTSMRLYIIARFGLRWIVETAEPEAGKKFPIKNGEKLLCTIIEGAPRWKTPKLPDDDVKYMQQTLSEHLTEYYKWIQVSEIVMTQRR